MTDRQTQLAVLMRKAQWMLDDAAFSIGGGRYSSTEAAELTTALDELAQALRAELPEVIEAEQ